MVVAAHIPCQGGRSETDKGPRLSQPKKEKRRAHVHTGTELHPANMSSVCFFQ